MMKLEEIKEGFSNFWDSVAEGWQRLRVSAASAMTRFKPGKDTGLPTKGEVDDEFYLPSQGWSLLGGDVFEDDKRVVVRLEVPGMDKKDLEIEVQGDALVVRGEKRFERESDEGRYRVLQCAYGNFRRIVPLATPVLTDKARADYKNGVLRIELPKVAMDKPRKLIIKVD
jgi:HSP20 family protein